MVEPGDRAALLHKLLEAAQELLGILVGVRFNRVVVSFFAGPACVGAPRNLAGLVLLYRHRGVEVFVGGSVGDSEATHAQHVLDTIFLAEACALREGNR